MIIGFPIHTGIEHHATCTPVISNSQGRQRQMGVILAAGSICTQDSNMCKLVCLHIHLTDMSVQCVVAVFCRASCVRHRIAMQ